MEELFKRLKIEPKDKNLYKTAFSHSSYVNEHKQKNDYERLEFLGDAVLELVMSDYLYNNYDKEEGEMTKIRASYVCENALYEYSMDLGLEKYLRLGHGELKEKGRYKKAIVADIFESLMAAIYLDLGFSTVRRIILEVIVPYIENPKVNFFNDYKSALQEYVQAEQDTIHYNLIDEVGPSHNKTFTVDVLVDGIVYGRGVGSSKKEADQESAKVALDKLAKIN